MAAAANDPGAASGVLAPPSCGVPSGTPRRSSLRLPLSLPGSFASLTMITRTDSYAGGESVPLGVTGGVLDVRYVVEDDDETPPTRR